MCRLDQVPRYPCNCFDRKWNGCREFAAASRQVVLTEGNAGRPSGRIHMSRTIDRAVPVGADAQFERSAFPELSHLPAPGEIS